MIIWNKRTIKVILHIQKTYNNCYRTYNNSQIEQRIIWSARDNTELYLQVTNLERNGGTKKALGYDKLQKRFLQGLFT